MRVCVICHEATWTDAIRVGFEVALFLAESHEVHLIAKCGGPLLEQPRYKKLKPTCGVVSTFDLSYADRVEKAVSVLEEIRPDLIYVNSVAAGDWCEAGARIGSVVILHTHEMSMVLPPLLAEIAGPRVLMWVDMLVGASKNTLYSIQEFTGVTIEKNFVLDIFGNSEAVLAQGNINADPPNNAKGHLLAYDHPMVAMCGIAEPRKGTDIFFDLARRLPQYDFLWIGAWEPADAINNTSVFERFCSESLDNFYVTGPTEHPGAYLRKIDAFVLTSREDPNPLVVAEALLFGKKVVAFSETGDSKALLERFGYVLSGAPDSERAAAILPAIIEGGDGSWLSGLADAIKSEIDPSEKLCRLQTLLEDLVREKREESACKSAAAVGVF